MHTFIAKDTLPAFHAVALERVTMTIAILTTRKWNTSFTVLSIEANLAATFKRTFTASVYRVTSFSTNWHIAQISLPALNILFHFISAKCIIKEKCYY
jgi:hypothetical protein